MPSREYLTVEEFNKYVNNIFAAEELLHYVPVMGEVSGISTVKGNSYFILKDKNAQLQVNCFNSEKTYVPVNGEAVKVTGSADYYIKSGKFSLNAFKIEPFGKGNLMLRLEQLKEKLLAEGIFDAAHKKQIPERSETIALITSLQGAALQDMLSVFYKKNSVQAITVIDVRVQGEYAVRDIVKALVNADKMNYGIIILARGGGSFEDLYCFNSEEIVRAVYSCKTPVISAIGHETDFTLCDYVSDERAITPTAAAERTAYGVDALKREALETLNDISEEINDKLENYSYGLRCLTDALRYKLASFKDYEEIRIKSISDRLAAHCAGIIEKEERSLKHFLDLFDTLSPVNTLKKGYFAVEKEENAVYGVGSLKLNDRISIISHDGSAEAEITKICTLENISE